MSLIDFFKDYKDYIESNNSHSLVLSKSKGRNLFKFIQLQNFQKKYGDLLYKHFKVMNSPDEYEFLFDYFGKKTLETAMQNEQATTQEIASILFKNKDFENFRTETGKIAVASRISDSIMLNKSTGFDITDITSGINPTRFSRKSYNGKTILDIFYGNNVTKDTLKQLYGIYGKEIINEFYNDDYLRNKSILALDSKYSNIIAVGGLQDHVTHYSEKDLDNVFQKYLRDEQLSKTEQVIVIGLLTKECDLISTYTVPHLLKHSDYIKSEIGIGIFNDIVVNNHQYSNEDRKIFTSLSNIWNHDDLQRYQNLRLLKARFSSLSSKYENQLDSINKILALAPSELHAHAQEIAKTMDSIFTDYEVANREDIINNVYTPPNQEMVIISDIFQMPSGAMLHFFNPDSKIFAFDDYVQDLEEQRSQELGKAFHFSEEEKEKLKSTYEGAQSHYIPSKSLDMVGLGQMGDFDTRYITNTSNQQSAMIVTAKDIAKGYGTRGNLALGFSKATLTPDLIATVSNKNIHSNKGIDYVESDNQFQDFSASYADLTNPENRDIRNNEVVLFRNTSESSLKPSYVMYISQSNDLSSGEERKNINTIKEQMKNAGLDVPIVIFEKTRINQQLREETSKLLGLEQYR